MRWAPSCSAFGNTGRWPPSIRSRFPSPLTADRQRGQNCRAHQAGDSATSSAELKAGRYLIENCARAGLRRWNGDLRTDVSAAITSLEFSDQLLGRSPSIPLEVVTILLKHAHGSAESHTIMMR